MIFRSLSVLNIKRTKCLHTEAASLFYSGIIDKSQEILYMQLTAKSLSVKICKGSVIEKLNIVNLDISTQSFFLCYGKRLHSLVNMSYNLPI